METIEHSFPKVPNMCLTHSSFCFWNGIFHLRIWTHSLEQMGSKSKNEISSANSLELNESSHQDVHCLQWYLVWSAELKELIIWNNNIKEHFDSQRTVKRQVLEVTAREHVEIIKLVTFCLRYNHNAIKWLRLPFLHDSVFVPLGSLSLFWLLWKTNSA